MLFQHGGQREDVAHVVIHDQHPLACQGPALGGEILQHGPPRFAQPRQVVVRRQQRQIEQPRHRMHFMDRDLRIRMPA